MLLRDALMQALGAENATVSTTSNKFEVNVEVFVRRFKEIWLYINDVQHPIDYEKFCGSLFLLLYKNLSVTNVSVYEIISLLKVHTASRQAENNYEVMFFSDEEYTKYLSNMVLSIIQSKLDNAISSDDRDQFITNIVNLCGDALNSTIILNVYFSSVLLHVPQSLSVNVRKIMAESGYIHSSGNAVYVRNVEKAIIGDLEHRLKTFLNGYSEKDVFITPYADEFFSPYDITSPVSIRNGLSGVKLQLRKHYIEGQPLLDYLATLPQRFKVQVPLGLKDFAKEREESKETTETKGTIWFVVDYALEKDDSLERPGRNEESLYLFVYAQSFLNDNQLILFKERKPGWYASITLPHTLSIALINVLRGQRRKRRGTVDGRRPVFLDPFYGTGTGLFDAALRMENTVIIGFDRDPIAAQVVKDNAKFFSLSVDDLRNFREAFSAGQSYLGKINSYSELMRSIRDLSLDRIVLELAAEEHAKLALKAVSTYVLELEVDGKVASLQNTISKSINYGLPEQLRTILLDPKTNFRVRILIYCIWRALALGTFSIRDNKDNVLGIISKEFEKVEREISHVIRGMERGEKAACGQFLEMEGLYSHAFLINNEKIGQLASEIQHIKFDEMAKMIRAGNDPDKWAPGIWLVDVEDSIEALALLEKRVDFLMTDPPYGFNMDTDGEAVLMNFFGKLVPRIVGVLRPQGQACLVLPAFAKNGRQIPFFETYQAIIRQFIAAANQADRPLVTEVETLPRPRGLFKKPFYWTSASVLERRIVHFSLG